MLGLSAYCLAFAAAQALAPEFGPVETRNHSALAMPFLRLEPRWGVLKPGERTLSVGFSIANDLRTMSNGSIKLSEDFEEQRILGRYRVGLANDSDVTIDVPVMARDGGFMDPLMDIWHRDVLQIHDNQRQYTPYGLSEVIIPGSHRFGSAAGILDVSGVYAKGFGPRLMGSVGVKLPTGDSDRLLGSGAIDGEVGLQARIPWGSHWTIDLTGGAVAQGKPKHLQSARGLIHQESISLEHRIDRWDNIVLQWQSENSALVTGISGADSTNRVLTLGLQHQLSRDKSYEFYFTDNGDWLNYRVPELVNVGAEFTWGLRLVTKF